MEDPNSGYGLDATHRGGMKYPHHLTSASVRRKVKTLVGPLFKRTFIWRMMRPRRFQLYCIGAPKTGTHSMAAIFATNYRSRHEPRTRETVALIVQAWQGSISHRKTIRRLHELDQALRLELTSSAPLGFFADVLAEAFPEARFVLTVREPRSWLESKVTHLIKCLEHGWLDLLPVHYGLEARAHPPEEQVLAAHGLPSLDRVLSFYAQRNRFIVNSIPRERLLILRTEDLSHSAERLARFAGISAHTLDMEQSHSFKAPRKHDVLARIDQAYLQSKIDQHCGEIIGLRSAAAADAHLAAAVSDRAGSCLSPAHS